MALEALEGLGCRHSMPATVRTRQTASNGLLEGRERAGADLIAPLGVDWVQYPPRLARLFVPEPECRRG